MNNYTMDCYETKREILNFSKKYQKESINKAKNLLVICNMDYLKAKVV